MGLYGKIENITLNSMDAAHHSDSLVGFGLTPEAQEGNEVIYDLLLDQAWSDTPIDTVSYFHDWVSARYGAGSDQSPEELYSAWEMVRGTVYNSSNAAVYAVTKSILELVPAIDGLLGFPGGHPTVVPYDPNVLVEAWRKLYAGGNQQPALWNNPAYQYDIVDWTRQVLANAFISLYQDLVAKYNASASEADIRDSGAELTKVLGTLDEVLSSNEKFRLDTWIKAARASAGDTGNADFFEYNARNQITLWGPDGQIEDYASKQWSGLVGSYYQQRWQMFVDYLIETPLNKYDNKAFHSKLLEWEIEWGNQKTQMPSASSTLDRREADVKTIISSTIEKMPEVF